MAGGRAEREEGGDGREERKRYREKLAKQPTDLDTSGARPETKNQSKAAAREPQIARATMSGRQGRRSAIGRALGSPCEAKSAEAWRRLRVVCVGVWMEGC